MSTDSRAEVPRSDVNVGGPDGDPPEYTIGTVTLAYMGDEARRWLWNELDDVRKRYIAIFMDDRDGTRG